MNKLLDFWAPYCGVCKMMAPSIEQLEKESNGKFELVKINAEESPEKTAEYKVMTLPTFILVDENGAELFRHSGPISKINLQAKINSILYKGE